MAEGLLRELTDAYEVHSAGTNPAGHIHPLAIEVMNERGIDPSGQHPKHVNDFLGRLPVKYLIIVCEGANESCPRIFPGMLNRQLWPVDDPATFVGSPEATKEKFRTVRDQIESKLKEWLHNEHRTNSTR
jgi:arsenate reductase